VQVSDLQLEKHVQMDHVPIPFLFQAGPKSFGASATSDPRVQGPHAIVLSRDTKKLSHFQHSQG
jgi:hypothetical protein